MLTSFLMVTVSGSSPIEVEKGVPGFISEGKNVSSSEKQRRSPEYTGGPIPTYLQLGEKWF